MAEKPILFNRDMVLAILEGRKTQTRRLIKPQPETRLCYAFAGSSGMPGTWGYPTKDTWKYWGEEYKLPDSLAEPDRRWKAPCKAGDILWVRETWTMLYYVDPDGYTHYDQKMYYYFADERPDITLYDDDGRMEEDQRIRWKPSIHMPREAARIFLKVTSVKMDRLHEITEEQIRAEGAVDQCCMCSFNRAYDQFGIDCAKGITRAIDCPLDMMFPNCGFQGLWNSTIKKEDQSIYGWDANPWVWVIEFERTEDPKA